MSEPALHELVRACVVGDTLVLALAGDLDLHMSLMVFPCLSEAVRPAEGPVVIDLREVTFVDCSGLELLLQIRRLVHAQGGTVQFLSPHSTLLRIVRYLAFEDLFEIIRDMGDALTDWP